MRAALRSIAAVLAGFIAASVVMMLVEGFNGRVLHPDLARAAAGLQDREQLRALLAAAPVSAFLVVIAGWLLGAVAGGWVAARLAARAGAVHGLVLGGLLMLAGAANNLMVPPPLWFWVPSLLVLLAGAWLGARLAPAR